MWVDDSEVLGLKSILDEGCVRSEEQVLFDMVIRQ